MSDNKNIFELINVFNDNILTNSIYDQLQCANLDFKTESIKNIQLNSLQQCKNLNSEIKSSTETQLLEEKQKNKKLEEEIKNIIEQEDEKQKILKITIPSCLNKNITATTVIIYGNVSGDIKAENVICMEGNINSNNIQANKIFTKDNLIENGTNDKKYNYRKKHPNCEYCKFKELKQDPLWTFIKRDTCIIKDKRVDDSTKIRAFFCSYYEPKEIEQGENNE